MGVINPKNVCQIALVVDDIEHVAKNYAELFGVPVPDIFQIPALKMRILPLKENRRQPVQSYVCLIWDKSCWNLRSQMMNQVLGSVSM